MKTTKYEIKYWEKLGMVAPICNPSTWEAKLGELWIGGQPEEHSETLPQINKQIK
jgi:hypothetical protein